MTETTTEDTIASPLDDSSVENPGPTKVIKPYTESEAHQRAVDARHYWPVMQVLRMAYERAVSGKGRVRHAEGNAFLHQPIMTVQDIVGPGFSLGQAIKKIDESQRLEPGEATEELLDAIVYLVGAILKRDDDALIADLPANPPQIWAMVDDFNFKSGQFNLNETVLYDLRTRLVREEFDEFMEAMRAYHDYLPVLRNNAWTAERSARYDELQAGLLKEICDLVYVVLGVVSDMELPFEEAFQLVHEANMSKLVDPSTDEGGKIEKGDHEAPDLVGLLRDGGV